MRRVKQGAILSAIVIAIAVQPSFAEEPEFDRSVAMAAIKRVQEKLQGDLRGSINHDDSVQLVTVEDLERPKNPYARPEIRIKLPDRRKPASGLLPMVSNQSFPVDRVITGGIKQDNAPALPFWEQFDSLGQELNPYPGD